ncbi:hypothetical protein GGH96_004882 [Coemansia sp. RSA 1972]|nr:hypothetical protein GGH96_004882 [Coemansia sp. RSA 1972]
MCHQQDGATTPKVPMHHKLKLSAFLNRQRTDQLLINRLKQKFSRDAVFVMGNWGASMTRYHELVRGKGWRTLLKCGGFPVYLINKYLTSSLCPTCENPVSTFHYVKNPRPYRRTRRPIVKCHGLVGCPSRTCTQFKGKHLGKVKRRLWNRDLLAVLNFWHILVSLRESGTIPERFQQRQPNEAVAAPHPTRNPPTPSLVNAS